jgi:hypothetical protein
LALRSSFSPSSSANDRNRGETIVAVFERGFVCGDRVGERAFFGLLSPSDAESLASARFSFRLFTRRFFDLPDVDDFATTVAAVVVAAAGAAVATDVAVADAVVVAVVVVVGLLRGDVGGEFDFDDDSALKSS